MTKDKTSLNLKGTAIAVEVKGVNNFLTVYVNKSELSKIAKLPSAEDHSKSGYVVLKDVWVDFTI